jgi:hypothetical protein
MYPVSLQPTNALRMPSDCTISAVDVNIEAGEAGLEEHHPIELEDDEPEAGPSGVGRQGDVKVEPTGSAPPAGNAVAEIVDEIAEAQVCEVENLC